MRLPGTATTEMPELDARDLTSVEFVVDERLRDQVARLVSIVLSPPGTMTAAVLLVASMERSAAGWSAAVVYILGAMILPYLSLFLLLRRGIISDLGMKERRERALPFALYIGIMLATFAVLALIDTPGQLLVFAKAHAVLTISVFAITLFWKISVHCMAVACLATVLVALFDGAVIWATVMTLVVTWARLQMRRHSIAQALCGTILGAVVCGAALAI